MRARATRPAGKRPMIKVSHLTRRFAGVTAVDDISFEVGRGEVVGFLGPNGAGKTTTLRILTGFLPATAGDAWVAGHNVRTDDMAVRRRIGYLPENCPLYPEMRVDEYLGYRAALKGVAARRIRRRVAEVREQCGLDGMGRRLIGQLSKGYRQRVGMADALVHQPPLLILDEPTIGLDPAQIREVRGLIRSLATQHTILLSTHILPEVEMTCQRVLILNRGRMVASNTAGDLQALIAGQGTVALEVEAPEAAVRDALGSVPGVRACTVARGEDGWLAVTLTCAGAADPRPDLFARVVQEGWRLRELRRERHRLEDVFVALIRREDGEAAG